jgi:hypothetical protein
MNAWGKTDATASIPKRQRYGIHNLNNCKAKKKWLMEKVNVRNRQPEEQSAPDIIHKWVHDAVISPRDHELRLTPGD